MFDGNHGYNLVTFNTNELDAGTIDLGGVSQPDSYSAWINTNRKEAA